MLIGSYSHGLDPKGRAFVPAKFREDLGDNFIVSQGIGKCLFAFSLDSWNEFTAKLKSLPLTDAAAQRFIRLLFSSATECEPDKQGRIVIPQRLRDYAQMDKEIVVNGVITRAEIWSKENWDKYSEEANEDFEDTLSKLSGFGI